MESADKIFEIGKLYCDRGDYDIAIEKLRTSSDLYFSQKNFDQYMKCQNLLLRMYAEKDLQNEITKTKESLQDLVLKEVFELTSKTYYTLALCASYKRQPEVALDYLQKSLSLALSKDNKEDMCYAICGLAIVYYSMDRLADALKEIYNLQVFFQVINIPDLKVSVELLNANILRKQKKYEESLNVLWSGYDLVKSTKNFALMVNVLYSMGTVYFELGDKEMAKMYFGLALRSLDEKNMVRLGKEIRRYTEMLGEDEAQNYDLVFDLKNHQVTEKKLGSIDFKNQFILLDLLRLFVQNQGIVYSKEYLVENVWRQNYDPSVHDNKIYVTIKRLRKLIEPDYDKPKYIFRAKNGYYMNKSARILIDQ